LHLLSKIVGLEYGPEPHPVPYCSRINEAVKARFRRANVNPRFSRMIPNKRGLSRAKPVQGGADLIIAVTNYLINRRVLLHPDQGRADRNVGDDTGLAGL
jgi:hypothetical protein